MSQYSSSSTIPYEISQDQDNFFFIGELSVVNEIYFQLVNIIGNSSQLLQLDESSESEHYESDVDVFLINQQSLLK